MFHRIQVISGSQGTGGRTKRRLPLLAFITLLLAMAVLFAGCQKPRTPAEELIAAMKKSSDFDTFEIAGSSSLNMEFQSGDPQDQTINQLLSNITLDLLQKCDKKTLRYQLDLKLLYKGENCGTLTLYADLEKIILQTPFLGPKQFFFSWEDSPALTTQYLNGIQIHIADYLPLIFDEGLATFKQIQEAAYPAYAKFLAERVTVSPEKTRITLTEKGEEKTYTCKEYILRYKYDETLQKDYSEFFVAILENETVRGLLKERIASFVEIAKNNGDLATWEWSEEEIMAFSGELDANLDQLVETLVEQYMSLSTSSSAGQIEMDQRISVDNSGLIRASVANQTIQLKEENAGLNAMVSTSMEMQWLNFGEELTFIELDPAKAFDAGKASEEEWAAIIEEVKINFLGQLLINPLFHEIMNLANMGN